MNASIAAFKYIQSGLPVPGYVQAAMRLVASPEHQPSVQPPEIYRSEEAPRQAQEEVLVGRRHRRRNSVVYDENMTEQDFIRVRSLRLTIYSLADHRDPEHRRVLH